MKAEAAVELAEAEVAKAKAAVELAETKAEAAVELAETKAEAALQKAQGDLKSFEEKCDYLKIGRLRDQGLLTGRGIYEFIIEEVVKELTLPTKNPPSKTNACGRIAKDVGKGKLSSEPPGKYSKYLYDIYQQCDINTEMLGKQSYNEICEDVHQYTWNGPSVLVYMSQLSQHSTNRCVLPKIAAVLGLELQVQLGK